MKPLFSRALALLLAICLGCGFVTTVGGSSAAASGGLLTTDEAAHLALLNGYRADRGLPPLAVDPRALADARDWARVLGQRGSLQHATDVQSDCQAGGDVCTGWAENIGQASTHQRVFDLYTASAGHAANMRKTTSAAGDTYRVGIGVYATSSSVFVVHRFYARSGSDSALRTSLQNQLAHARSFGAEVRADFVGSAGSQARIDAIAAPVLYGDDRGGPVTGLATSDEWLGALIDGFYLATLDRKADSSGKAYWIDRMRAGDSAAVVASQFFASDEYFAALDWSARAWVDDLYRELLGRLPTGSERDYWLGQLRRGASRGEVSRVIYQSIDSRRRRVTFLYQDLLGRNPDGSGLRFWADQLADGNDVRLAIFLASSDEYFANV